jgi:acetylornithine aminotransferase
MTEKTDHPGAATAERQARWNAAFMANYGTPPLAIERGAGVHVWDVDGTEYLDLYAGIAVSALGHAHPAVIEAVSRQIGQVGHTSNLMINERALELGERLSGMVGGDARVFLCNSGTEAVEAAIKVVRRHHGDRSQLIAADGAFHGRTLGALSITGQPAKRAPFAPLLPDVTFIPYGDADALRAAVTDQTAAVFLEPVLGEAGIIPAPDGYLETAREVCDATGALLVLDEVQGGVGRAGAWFSHQVTAPTVQADVITMAKGLGGGLPIGACIARGAAGSALQPGDHGSTFGGNPVSCAAALATLDVIESADLLGAARTRGAQLAAALDHPAIDFVRGIGLWRGVVLREPIAPAVEARARLHGALVNAVSPTVIRLAPALVVTGDEIDAGVAALHKALEEVSG